MKTFIKIFYLLSCIAVAAVYFETTGRVRLIGDKLPEFTLLAGLMIPTVLLFVGYVALRNLLIFLSWTVLAILMLWIYVELKDRKILMMQRGSSINSFKSLFVFLFLFFLGRVLILKLTGKEYVTPAKGGQPDVWEDRQPRAVDFILFSILFFSIIVAQHL